MHVTRELVPLDLKSIAEEADLIVEGVIAGRLSRLSPDECTVVTDYTLVVRVVVAGAVPLRDKPGANPLSFAAPGGETVIDDVKVTVLDEQLMPLRNGQHVIVFLAKSAENGRYELVGTVSGAFDVTSDELVKPLMAESGLSASQLGANREEFVDRVRSFHRNKMRR